MFEIVLVEPEIPHNAGAAGRLAVATGSRLHLIKPLGFSLDEKAVRRAGLDYWKHVELKVWESWQEFQDANPDARQWFLSTKGTWTSLGRRSSKRVTSSSLERRPGDFRRRFGANSRIQQQLLRIPMAEGPIRSLNLSTSIAVVLYEGMRQVQGSSELP